MDLGVNGKNHMFDLDPSMYMLYKNIDNPGDFCPSKDYSDIKTCIVSFTPRADEDNKWVLGSLFNRAHLSIYEVRGKHSRIGFINNG